MRSFTFYIALPMFMYIYVMPAIGAIQVTGGMPVLLAGGFIFSCVLNGITFLITLLDDDYRTKRLSTLVLIISAFIGAGLGLIITSKLLTVVVMFNLLKLVGVSLLTFACLAVCKTPLSSKTTI